MWDAIKNIIDTNQSFVVTSHVNPDGDSIGSALALCEFLKAQGKDAMVAMSDATPMVYKWLDPDREMMAPADGADLTHIAGVDAIFIVDVNSWERLGRIGEAIKHAPAVKAVIDHHPYRESITPHSVIQTEASSTAELIYNLIDTLGGPITKRAAEALYTGILTDTGSFRFANTSAHAHHITASLLEHSVKPALVYDLVYNQNSEARTRLMGQVISDIQFAGNGQVAWLTVGPSMIEDAGALPEDTSGFVDTTMTIAGVEIGIIFVGTHEGTVRISLRSRGNKNVNAVAAHFGGGGHKNASGVVYKGSIEEAVNAVTSAAVAAL
jgi:nanoRNase/pAp phosphatase (c-di-AMP/oligoRNAs hydrolase)